MNSPPIMKFSPIIVLSCLSSAAGFSAAKHSAAPKHHKFVSTGRKVIHAVEKGADVLNKVLSIFRRGEVDGDHGDVLMARDLEDDDFFILRDLFHGLLEDGALGGAGEAGPNPPFEAPEANPAASRRKHRRRPHKKSAASQAEQMDALPPHDGRAHAHHPLALARLEIDELDCLGNYPGGCYLTRN